MRYHDSPEYRRLVDLMNTAQKTTWRDIKELKMTDEEEFEKWLSGYEKEEAFNHDTDYTDEDMKAAFMAGIDRVLDKTQ